ncbi:MAG TPA: AsmA family protein [Candidatus Omnitrophota bacterium]|nr:AsmA family protein [Candidatus Omnitrophota bacterium]
MKKILKVVVVILAIVLLLSLAAGVTAFFVLKNFDPNAFKPQIISQAQQALGRQVQVGDMKVKISLSQGLSVNVDGFVIADDPQFSKKPFASLGKVSLGLDLLGVVTKRQINVSTVEILEPRISLVRNAEGMFNFQTLAILKESNDRSSAASSAAPAGALAAILIQNIFISNGVLDFEDHWEEDKSLQLAQIDFKISDFSLTRPFKVFLKAACLSAQQNVTATSMAEVDVLHAAGILKDLRAQVDIGTLDARLIEKIVPAMAAAKLQNPFKGRFQCVADEIRLSAKGAQIKKMQGSLSGGEAKTLFLKVPVQNLEANMEIIGENLSIPQASCALGKGRVQMNATIDRYLSSQEYAFQIDASDIDVGQVVNQGGQEVLLEGVVSGKATMQGKAFESLAAMKPASGSVTVQLKDGKLININILKVVLDKMSMLPGLSEKLKQSLPEQYRSKLEQNNTNIHSVDLDVGIRSGQMDIRSAKAQADIFLLSGQGMVDLDLQMNLAARLIIPKDLSESMATAVKELVFLTDTQGQITIPVTISGRAPDRLSYMPDLEYLGRQLFEARGREELGRLLDKALDRGKTAEDGSSSTQAIPGKEIIGNVLDAIFKK